MTTTKNPAKKLLIATKTIKKVSVKSKVRAGQVVPL
jgi:hypothetical protein